MNGSTLTLGLVAGLALGAVVGRRGSAARAASGMGRYRFVTNCIGSTYEDIRALKETATGVSRATFAKALGPEQWKWVQKSLGYDRDFSISRDWHVGYDKGTYRGVPAYWITHSGIEWIFTLDGEQGKSRARRGSLATGKSAPVKRTLTDDQRLDVLGEALDRGAQGWGGMCGAAARAMNRVLFDGKGTLVAAVNQHLWKRGRPVGHIGIRHRGIVWDLEGTYEGDAIEEFLAWGMLDPEDADYDLPNEQAAEQVILLAGKDAEHAADAMGCPRVDPEAVLIEARKAVLGW